MPPANLTVIPLTLNEREVGALKMAAHKALRDPASQARYFIRLCCGLVTPDDTAAIKLCPETAETEGAHVR